MKIYSAKQQRTLDAKAVELGIPEILLMEHAALAVFHYIEARNPIDQRIVIVCGRGNNGGDGFALARLCHQKGYHVQIICSVSDMSLLEAQYAHMAKQLHIALYEGRDEDVLHEILSSAHIIVDALYGSGLSRDIVGFDKILISLMNQSNAYTIGVDLPSGLYADSGLIGGCVVTCDATICFGYGKLGLFINEGLRVAGDVKVVDIGLPKQLEATMDDEIIALDSEVVRKCLPKRPRNSHKGSYGKALFIGGSESMSGAISMAIQAALRCGVGTITCAAPASVCEMLAKKIDECMYLYLDEVNGEISEHAYIEHLEAYDVIAIGNGMGRSKGAQKLVNTILASELPCILDGDALYLASQTKTLKYRKATTILTPHPREFSYLSGISTGEILKNPVSALKSWFKSMPMTCVALKNTTTLLYDGEKRYINIIGNNGLATGGSGDVLCGIVCAFLAQKASCIDALCCGVYLHAYCADILVKEGMPTYSLLPRDIIEVLPHTLSILLEPQKK